MDPTYFVLLGKLQGAYLLYFRELSMHIIMTHAYMIIMMWSSICSLLMPSEIYWCYVVTTCNAPVADGIFMFGHYFYLDMDDKPAFIW